MPDSKGELKRYDLHTYDEPTNIIYEMADGEWMKSADVLSALSTAEKMMDTLRNEISRLDAALSAAEQRIEEQEKRTKEAHDFGYWKGREQGRSDAEEAYENDEDTSWAAFLASQKEKPKKQSAEEMNKELSYYYE